MDYGLWTMDYGLWSMVYGLWSMDYGLWTKTTKADITIRLALIY